MTRRICICTGSLDVPPEWHPWQAGNGHWHIWRTDEQQAVVPTGAREVARSDMLPVTEDEIEAASERFKEYQSLGMGALSAAEQQDDIRVRRGDPSHDWYAWVTPLEMGSSEAAGEAWVEATDGSIGTEHSHVVVRAENGGWLGYAGLGSHMLQARRRPGRGGCKFGSRQDARDAAVALVAGLRARAVTSLRERLDGWSLEAVEARLSPNRAMRLIAGWMPLSAEILVHEFVGGKPRSSAGSWDAPVVERVSLDE